MNDCENCNPLSDGSTRFLIGASILMLVVSAVLILQYGIPALANIGAAPSTPSSIVASPLNTPPTTPPRIAAATATTPPITAAPERDFVTRVNAERAGRGIAPLTLNPVLSDAMAAYARNPALDLGDILVDRGYVYTAIQVISATGIDDDVRLFNEFWNGGYQAQLSDADYNEIGMSDGDTTFIILAEVPRLTAPNASLARVGALTQTGQEAEIVQLLNEARQADGLSPVRVNPVLSQVALAHSEDQAARDRMGHDGSDGSTPADRVTRNNYDYRLTGENVLSSAFQHASYAFDGWWNSPPHYENMMNAGYTEIGIAYAISDSGQYYYTMVLGTPR